jgi:hypothetical protein
MNTAILYDEKETYTDKQTTPLSPIKVKAINKGRELQLDVVVEILGRTE